MAQWTTRDFGAPAVRWGAQSGTAQHQNNGSYSTYTKLQLCGAPANSIGATPQHGTSSLEVQAEHRPIMRGLPEPAKLHSKRSLLCHIRAVVECKLCLRGELPGPQSFP